MRDPARVDRDRSEDMLAAILKMVERSSAGRQAFEEDELLQGWLVFQLLILGEAAAHVSPALRGRHPEVPWRQIIDLRNVLIHGYSTVDYGIVWWVVERDVPELRRAIEAILEQLS